MNSIRSIGAATLIALLTIGALLSAADARTTYDARATQVGTALNVHLGQQSCKHGLTVRRIVFAGSALGAISLGVLDLGPDGTRSEKTRKVQLAPHRTVIRLTAAQDHQVYFKAFAGDLTFTESTVAPIPGCK